MRDDRRRAPAGPGTKMVLLAALIALALLTLAAFWLRRRRAGVSTVPTTLSGEDSASAQQSYAFDKAKYHAESVEEQGLPEQHAYHHTTYFLSWLIRNGLMSEGFEQQGRRELEDYRSGRIGINTLYEHWDCCLISDMLGTEGNAFAHAYFDFSGGAWIGDYIELLQGRLPTEFHIPYTAENEAQIHRVIDARFAAWRADRG